MLSTEEVVSEIFARCESRKQGERVLFFYLFGDRYGYTRAAWYRIAAETQSLGLRPPWYNDLSREDRAAA